MKHLLPFAAALLLAAAAGHAAAETGQIWKSPTCGCCTKWVEHMAAHGFALEGKDVSPRELNQRKAELGLKPEQSSCHTALIDGYTIEGHVPAEDVKRLLAERPDAIGLAVPGMPVGSPGMETGPAEAYEVLLIKRDGTSEVFARH
jgi:hypothetical protein